MLLGAPVGFKPRQKKDEGIAAGEDPEAQAAADDFERMLAEMKLEEQGPMAAADAGNPEHGVLQ